MAFTDKDREKLTELHTLMGSVVLPKIKENRERLDEHEELLDVIETRHARFVGGVAVISALFGGFINWIGGHHG